MKNLSKKPGDRGGTSGAPLAEVKPAWENPLIPSKRLREIYSAMVGLRLLEAHTAATNRSRKSARLSPARHGQEACLVSTMLSLNSTDLISIPAPDTAVAFLRTAKLDPAIPRKSSSTELPAPSDSTARLYLAVGSALALSSSSQKGSLTLAYTDSGDLAPAQWKPILRLAAANAAPILFVVLPAPGKQGKPGSLALSATLSGVPGIPVDASDPIALYRVAQESMLRIRAGGGPALMECIPFQLPGKAHEPTDPILRMQQLLLPRGIATEAWFNEVEARHTSRIRALRS